jgi:hypothetical protein
MKNTFAYSAIVLLCFVYSQSHAQAFERKSILLSFGLGGIADVTGASSSGEFGPPTHIEFSPLRPQFLFKGEFAVHKYWGVGFIASVDGRANMSYPYSQGLRYSAINTQLGLLVNYHFYQLIADKLHNPKKMHADKLDIYTGFSIGAAMNAGHVDGFPSQNPSFAPFMGLHLGIRYYVTQHLSVYGELGIGQSYFNTGITYKFNRVKKPKVPKDF